MQIAVYVNDNLYKTIEVGAESYSVPQMIKLVHKDIEAGLIPGLTLENKVTIHITPVNN